MLNPWLVFGVAIGIVLAAAVIALTCIVGLVVGDRLDDRRKRRTADRRRERIDLDGPDAIEAWGEPIPMVWPTRAPRNGDPFDEAPR